MDIFDLKKFSIKAETPLPKKAKPLPRHKQGEKFLKGPIPWAWLTQAAQQPGRAIHVALALWLIAGMEKSVMVALSPKLVREMGVMRQAMYRGLASLVRAGLVCIVDRHRGRNTVVEILPVAREHEGWATEDNRSVPSHQSAQEKRRASNDHTYNNYEETSRK